MAVALLLSTELERCPMTRSKTLIALTFLAIASPLATTVAEAGDWTSSSMYNGYGATTQNTASNYSMRDANGNMTMVNGMIEPSVMSQTSGGQSASSYAGGVGMAGAGMASGQATAIGNSLNVTVIGSHNTTIIDSQQTNNGNQTATADLNSH
jgi:holdfast attachment protein HfaA